MLDMILKAEVTNELDGVKTIDLFLVPASILVAALGVKADSSHES